MEISINYRFSSLVIERIDIDMIIKRDYFISENINNIQLKVIEYGHAISGSEWSGNIITPPYSRLYYIAGGDPYIIDNGKCIHLLVGHCYLIPTGYSFRYACKSSMEQLYFHINILDFNGFDLLKNCKNLMELNVGCDKIPMLINLSKQNNLYSVLLLRQELYSSLLSLIGKYNITLNSVNYSECVLLAIEYINSHLTLQLSISDLATNTFVSVSTLSKKFKSEVGMTISSYIYEKIMLESEQLLRKTGLTILQISDKFGFCDQFYFSRRFKEKYGVSPQKYRHNCPI